MCRFALDIFAIVEYLVYRFNNRIAKPHAKTPANTGLELCVDNPVFGIDWHENRGQTWG